MSTLIHTLNGLPRKGGTMLVLIFLIACSSPPDDGLCRVTGMVYDSQGRPVAGVTVRCYRLKDIAGQELRYGSTDVATDIDGSYSLEMPSDFRYELIAGGVKSTIVTSKRFLAESRTVYEVEDLIVRRANKSVYTRILDEAGRPLERLPLTYQSKSFSPPGMSLAQFGQTNATGAFNIPHLLPDEPFSVSVVLSSNSAHIWRELDPNKKEMTLTLRAGNYVDLPPEWEANGDLQFFASVNTHVLEDRLVFELPDLEGNLVSSTDKRFEDKVLLVNIWGTWCGSCQVEIPHLVELQRTYGELGFEIIGVAFENGTEAEQRELVKRYAEAKQMNYTILLGGAPEFENVESVLRGIESFTGFPETVFIGRSKRVDHVQHSFLAGTPERLDWQLGRMRQSIEKLLQ